MPVILPPADYDLWLDPGITDPARVNDLLKPFDARLMRVYPVSLTVNKVENDGPECAEESHLVQMIPRNRLYFDCLSDAIGAISRRIALISIPAFRCAWAAF
jgi:SOS response associated peptidase (SRAP)